MIEIINRILPIILLLLIGKWFHFRKVFSSETISELKKLVVNVALPAVLFLSFLSVDLQPNYFWFIPILFGYCVLLYVFGLGLQRFLHLKGDYFPFLITGFEYGMIGVSLFGAAYGLEQIGKIAIVDLGQEVFVWFVFVALLIHKRDGESNPKQLFRMFGTSPVIIAIIAGLIFNFSGLVERFEDVLFVGGLLAAIRLVGSLTVPLILLVVGYGIQVDWQELFFSARVILIRLSINIPTALILNRFLVREWMGLDPGFEAALFTLLILPPPFIMTLFMKHDRTEEIHRVNNVLMLHTIITIFVFIIYFALHPTI